MSILSGSGISIHQSHSISRRVVIVRVAFLYMSLFMYSHYEAKL